MRQFTKILIIMVAFGLMFGFAAKLTADDTKKGTEVKKSEEKVKAVYVCPMKKCNVKADKPGKCPKCGMKLKKEEAHKGCDPAACPAAKDCAHAKKAKDAKDAKKHDQKHDHKH